MEESKFSTQTNDNKSKLKLSLDYRFICMLLLAVIAVMLFLWKPWATPDTSDRTISITGDTTVKAEPDEYSFSPSYQFKNTSKEKALADLTKKSDEIVTELKKLGVADSKIKNNSSGYDSGVYYPTESNGSSVYSLNLSITVENKELAQKVQDYLVKTNPTGTVTPYVQFSDAKRKELENKARDEATKDARAKADQSASNLGFKVGSVQSVKDGSGFGDYYPYSGTARSGALDAAESSEPKLTIQPGENELNYSVTVVYYIK